MHLIVFGFGIYYLFYFEYLGTKLGLPVFIASLIFLVNGLLSRQISTFILRKSNIDLSRLDIYINFSLLAVVYKTSYFAFDIDQYT